jgi:3-hydroxyacyl-[acyl-carrier-protein] dehydratase
MAEVLDISQIKAALPYGYPMVLVDRFCAESDTKFVGLKTLTFNEEFFQGHFPNHPILPGVLQVEAMKQVAVLGLAKKLDPQDQHNIYIKSLKKVKFRRPNNPGDRMLIEIEVKSESEDGFVLAASTKNNSGVTCQTEMVLSVRPKEAAHQMPTLYSENDKSEDIHMDINQIKELIPHRYPFLFIDYIISAEGPNVKAVKNVTYNEPFFHGYSSDYPVLPGAFQCEIIAQAGCAHTLAKPENEGKLAFFLSIDYANFLKPVRPGDQLVIEVHVPDANSRFGRGEGVMTVEGEKVIEMAMKFALVDP